MFRILYHNLFGESLTKMGIKIVLLQIVFIYFMKCEERFGEVLGNDSIALQSLSEKFQQNCRNPKELNAIKKLSQIISDIKQFEHQLSKDRKYSSAQHKNGIIDERVSDFVTYVVTTILKEVDIRNFWSSLKEGVSTSLTCLACHSVMKIIFSKIFGIETLAFAFINICYAMNLSDYDVCQGYITTFKDQVNYIKQNTKLNTIEMCGLIMGDQCYSGDSVNLYWKLNVPEKSDMVTRKAKISKLRKRKFNILHITDIHLDMEYVPNTANECKTIYCCRRSGKNIEPNMSVNYWGSYPCDTPIQTLDNWAKHVNWENIDLTYWTGDVIPHDSWNDTRSKSIRASEVIMNYFKTYSKNKLVVSAIGNHIAIPVGCFPPPLPDNEFTISWLYNDLAEQWSHWLPGEALDTVRIGGYYALKIRPGFRIIVMNTNYCARLNIWTFYKSIDPADHLKWLITQLDAAERENDSVHIVGHIPPDNRECTQSWLYNFMAIVERYSDTIVGQFYGHTHIDEFRVLYSVNNSSKPIGLEIISPSLTTYDIMNPGYRVISCNKNGDILDMDTYAFDLNEANRDHKSVPKWYHEYSMADTYSLKSFDGQSFDALIKSFDTNEELLHTFYTLSLRNSSYAKTYCDKMCKTMFIYDTVIANPYIQKPKPFLRP